MKGLNEKQLGEKIAYIHGRLEHQIECFAISLGVESGWLAQRVGALLLGVGSGNEDSLRSLPVQTGGASQLLQQMEASGDPRASKARREEIDMFAKAAASDSRKKVDAVVKKLQRFGKKKKRGPAIGARQAWWYKLTRAQKDAVIAKRVANTKKAKVAKKKAAA